jgi:alkylation response protein AidB-like acyl-CoA dehydrogenase
MEFGLTEQQLSMQANLQRLLQDHAGLDRVREAVAQGPVHDGQIWQGLAGLGLTGLLVPAEYGGLGLSLLDAALVQETLGANVTPVAYTATAILAPLALAMAGTEQQKMTWLPAIADGSLQVAIGLVAGSGRQRSVGITVVDGQLSGRVPFVLGAPGADLFLVNSSEGDLYVIPRDAGGVQLVALRSIDDTRSLSELKLYKVTAELLPEGDEDIIQPLLDAGRTALAADTLGAAQHMLDMAVEYAGQRTQFGRAIGSFQAVKHLCSEMAAELEPCRALVWYAAHAYDALPAERTMFACHAKAQLAEVGSFVARTATEVYGGMGFTDLLGLHYWFKRIGFDRQILGSPEQVREQAARAQGWL